MVGAAVVGGGTVVGGAVVVGAAVVVVVLEADDAGARVVGEEVGEVLQAAATDPMTTATAVVRTDRARAFVIPPL
jgi:hypothetical protein